MAKTYEMRLIDANALDREAEESLRENPHTEGIHRAMHTHEHNHFLCMIAHQPTIDPETIPIVRQLREELARVTAERDAAVKKYEAEKEDFLDYALSGTQNAAPFCTNRHPDCVDKRGWCIPVKCHGFSRDEED